MHFFVLHILISLDDPEQFFPPPDGGGESQTRDLDFIPPLQIAEHFVHSLHEDQFPSMVASKIYMQLESKCLDNLFMHKI